MGTKSYENFSKLIQIKNITTYRVSKDTGIAQSTFSDWKKGKSVPKYDKLKSISDYLGVDVELFLDEPLYDATPALKKVTQAVNKSMSTYKKRPTTGNSDKPISDDSLVDQIIEKLNGLSPELKKVALAQLDSLTKLQEKQGN